MLLVVVLYPYYNEKLYTIPVLGDFPDVHTGVVMLDLRDDGHRAQRRRRVRRAARPRVRRLLRDRCVYRRLVRSVQFAGQNADGSAKRFIHFGSIDVDKSLGGIHITPWLLLLVAGRVRTALIGMLIGLPTLRLRGDYLAIVTLGFGEILPQVARNGDNLFGPERQPNGPQRDRAARPARLRSHALPLGRPAGELPDGAQRR